MGVNKIIIAIIFFLTLPLHACTHRPEREVQGYIEGDYTYISASVSGTLTDLKVDKGFEVRRGQLLLELEKQPEADAYTAAVQIHQEARAARDAVAADLTFAKVTFERNRILVQRKAIEQAELDNARSRYEATLAKLAQADATIAQTHANVEQAKWTLQQKTLASPIDGIVFDKFYIIGEYVEAKKPILSLLAPENVKAIFFVNQSILGDIRLGDKVSVACDGCSKNYIGHIRFISPSAEYTPPVIFSNDTNEKLIYRIEASFAPNDAKLLHPGQPISVTFYTHER